jgi:hypothetical protein
MRAKCESAICCVSRRIVSFTVCGMLSVAMGASVQADDRYPTIYAAAAFGYLHDYYDLLLFQSTDGGATMWPMLNPIRNVPPDDPTLLNGPLFTPTGGRFVDHDVIKYNSKFWLAGTWFPSVGGSPEATYIPVHTGNSLRALSTTPTYTITESSAPSPTLARSPQFFLDSDNSLHLTISFLFRATAGIGKPYISDYDANTNTWSNPSPVLGDFGPDVGVGDHSILKCGDTYYMACTF